MSRAFDLEPNKPRGGEAIYVKDRFSSSIIADLGQNDEYSECVFVEVSCGPKKATIGAT